MLNIPRPPNSITCTNINVLVNIGPGAGGGRKRRGKKGNFPTLLTMIVGSEKDIILIAFFLNNE